MCILSTIGIIFGVCICGQILKHGGGICNQTLKNWQNGLIMSDVALFSEYCFYNIRNI